MQQVALTWLAALPLLAAGCGPQVQVEKALAITDLQTGWYDAGIVEGNKNKLIPSVVFRLHNVSSQPVAGVQVNAIFRRVTEQEGWGEHFAQAIGSSGLAPGATTRDIVLRSNLGYTGTQPRMQLLQNREFVDAKVDIFAKQGSRTWAKIGNYTIDRQLLTR